MPAHEYVVPQSPFQLVDRAVVDLRRARDILQLLAHLPVLSTFASLSDDDLSAHLLDGGSVVEKRLLSRRLGSKLRLGESLARKRRLLFVVLDFLQFDERDLEVASLLLLWRCRWKVSDSGTRA